MDNPRFLFLIENYNLFYTRYYELNPSLAEKSYEEQLKELLGTLYYHGDSYSSVIRSLGFETDTIIMDCKPLQLTWLKENNYPLYLRWMSGKLSRTYQFRFRKNFDAHLPIYFRTVKAQVEKMKPDFIFVYSGVKVDRDLLDFFKKRKIKLILHWSTLWLEGFPYEYFDQVITSARQFQAMLHEKGFPCLEFQQAFDDRILAKLGPKPDKDIDVSFIGNFIPYNSSLRIRILEYLCRNSGIQIFGSGTAILDADSPVHAHHQGTTGGLDMYRILQRSKISLHIRNDRLADFAGAKRYFEVTGAGTMLLAFHQDNISEYFEPGKEIVTFRDEFECLEKIQYYLEHEEERERIAKAGQERILRDHTFKQRAPELLRQLGVRD